MARDATPPRRCCAGPGQPAAGDGFELRDVVRQHAAADGDAVGHDQLGTADRRPGGGGGFEYQVQARAAGMRATRQPSPWMGDYGQFLLMPQTGPLVTDPNAAAVAVRAGTASTVPAGLPEGGPAASTTSAVELTPTDRCAVLRLTFRSAAIGRLIVDPAERRPTDRMWSSTAGSSAGGRRPSAATRRRRISRLTSSIELDRDFTATGTFAGSDKHFVRSPAAGRTGRARPGTPSSPP